MQYYRLWIYACNMILLVGALGFAMAVGRCLLFSSDLRRYLVPGVPRALEPITLYAYLTMILQLGLVQILGYMAAKRLNTILLNAYWLLLLALFFGDVIIGVTWVFRFERIRTELRSTLRLRLQVEYSKEPNFSEQWNELQREFSCCGVTGPLDFGPEWPQSCCSTPSVIISSSTPSATAVSTKKVVMVARSDQYSESDDENFAGVNSSRSIDSDPTLSGKCEQPRTRGCEETLQIWLRKTADLLFVLGFCVIAFTKFCFLGILRYEIREMIQKIRLMKEPTPENIPPAQPFCPLQQQLQQLVDLSSNNAEFEGITTAMTVPAQNPIGTHSRLGREDLSSQTMGDKMRSSKQPSIVANHYDVGADSDTNSHCALILEESTPPARHYVSPSNRRQQQWPGKGTPSVNSLELQELNFSTSLHTTDDSSKTQVKELHP